MNQRTILENICSKCEYMCVYIYNIWGCISSEKEEEAFMEKYVKSPRKDSIKLNITTKRY